MDKMIADGEDDIILQQFKVGDPSLKTKCLRDLWANAFIMLMVVHYKDAPVPFVDKIEKDEEKQDEDDTSNLRKFIITVFEITNNASDFLPNDVILDTFNKRKYGDISQKKIGIELKSINLNSGKKLGNRGYFGIKKRPPPVPLDDEGNEIFVDSNMC
jgi:hypothetical protein